MNENTKIYAAYGSNMNIKQMQYRCPKAKVLGIAKLKNYRLVFRGMTKGVANIERQNGRTVPIVLWSITPECEKALDIYEGYPGLYIKKTVDVNMSSSLIKAMAYVMIKHYENSPAKPLKHYIDTIWNGYVANKIPVRILREAILENEREI
jgi:hypothetical protein